MSRRSALGLVAAAVGAATIFVLLTVFAGIRPTPTAADLDIQREFLDQRGQVLTALARTLTWLGSSPELYAALLGAVLVAWRTGRLPRLAVCCLLWFAAGQLLRTTINQVIERPRPPLDLHLTGAAGYAFPSGHTSSATIGYGLAAFLVAVHAQRRRTAVVCAVAAVVGAIGVGLSRIYLGVHWPSDVAAGWAFGVVWLSLGAALYARSARHRPPPSPAEAEVEEPAQEPAASQS